jgi:hypothetical protein
MTIRRCAALVRHGLSFMIGAAVWLALAGPASAQDVGIRPMLRAGDAFRIEVVRTREDSSRPQQNGRSRTAVDVRVQAAGPDGLLVDWAPGDTSFDNPQIAKDPLMIASAEALRGLRFRLALNADGEFQEVANASEIVPTLQSAVDGIVAGLSERLPAEARASFEETVRRILSPAALIASATRDAQIYFAMNGVTLEAGETVEVPVEQPSPIGDGMMSATLRVRLDSATDAEATLRTTTTYDPADFVRATRALAQQFGKPIPEAELAKLPPIHVTDEGAYAFDRSVGLMREITVRRRMTMGTNSRLDAWEIRLVTPPQR